MKKQLLSTLLALCMALALLPGTAWASSLAETTLIPDDAVAFNGHMYKLYDQSMTWTEAKSQCENVGGHLVTITSAEEQQFIEQIMDKATKHQYWIGLTSASGSMAWVTGEAYSYSHWDSGEPNYSPRSDGEYENYVHIYNVYNSAVSGSSRFYWNDMFYDNTYPGEESNFSMQYVGYICEWDYIPSESEYIYSISDLGADITLDAGRLNGVTDSASAATAVRDMVGGMTQEQKGSATGVDLATLYAETAVAKAASKSVVGTDILINAAAVADVAAEAAQTLSAVENALSNGGITTVRELSQTVTLLTNETEITIRIDPDVLGTKVDKVCVETPGYALTFKLSDLAPDLTSILTFKAAPTNIETLSVKNAVDIEMPGGSMASSITVSLPTDKSTDTTYQAVVSSNGTAAASKYNPATTNIDGKVNASGTYTVETNEMDFTDITSKSTEMQKAIKYLAAHGIVMGSGGTNYSPDDSISRAELTALVLRALGKVDSKATTSFTDVTPANWFYATAASSQKLGYITGFEDNTFRGTTTINKEQIIVVAARVLGGEMNYKTPSNPAAYLSKYSDTVVSWAQPQVALATRENLVVYRTDGTFSGAKNMTRGDAAIIIYRLFQRIW